MVAGGVIRSPNASSMTWPTFAATSMPTSSSSVMGPTGKPHARSAGVDRAMSAPSTSRCAASFMYGARMRVV